MATGDIVPKQGNNLVPEQRQKLIAKRRQFATETISIFHFDKVTTLYVVDLLKRNKYLRALTLTLNKNLVRTATFAF